MLVGKDLTDQAIKSVSTIEEQNFFNSSPVAVIVRAKKGTPVFFTNNMAESEAIFLPGTKAVITNAKAVSFEKKGEVKTRLIIELEMG